MGYVGTVAVAQIIQVFKMVLHPANAIRMVPILVVPNSDGVDQNLIIINRIIAVVTTVWIFELFRHLILPGNPA